MEDYTLYLPSKKKGFYLDPRTKIFFMGVLTTLLSYEHSDILFVGVAAFIPCVLLLFNGQKKTAFIYGGLFAFGIVAKSTQDLLVLPQVLNAISVLLIALVMRLFPTFMLGYYLIKSTTVGEFVVAMQRMHVTDKFIIPVSVVFRFVPTIAEESRSITYAMKMREINFGTKRFRKNPSLFLEYRIIPLMMSIVKIGEELSAAALTKGLGSNIKRQSIAIVGFTFYDVLLFTVSILLIIWVVG